MRGRAGFSHLLALAALAVALTVSTANAQAADPSISPLARDPVWLKLLHSNAGGQSDILTPAFFLAPDGAHNPQAELVATIAALRAPVIGDPDQHARCRFPARFAWLRQRLGWTSAEAPPITCPAFEAWRGAAPITGASLIFVGGSMRNPASYYGHVLLKLNSAPTADDPGSLLDKTLDFAADVPPDENPVSNVVRGLIGGYRSTFTQVQFVDERLKYSDSELRSIWEYELELNPAQTGLLVDHIWEVIHTNEQYYFLSRNCASGIVELLNLVIDAPLTPPDKAWMMPIDVFDRLMRQRPGQPPLVRAVRRIDPEQIRFREAYFDLSADEQAQVRAFIAAGDGQQMPPGNPKIVEVLTHYYLSLTDPPAPANPRAAHMLALLAGGRAEASQAGRAAPSASGPWPHDGQKSSMLRVSGLDNSRLGNGAELRFRGAGYDFLSFEPGAAPGTELSVFDARIDEWADHLAIRSLDIMRVTNLNLAPTGLPNSGGPAWKLRFGVEDRDLACSDCRALFIEGGWGKAAQLGQPVQIYAFLNGRIDGDSNPDQRLQAGPSVGVILDPARAWRADLEVGAWRELDGAQQTHTTAKAEIRFGASPDWDLRLGVEYQNLGGGAVTESQLGLARYF